MTRRPEPSPALDRVERSAATKPHPNCTTAARGWCLGAPRRPPRLD